MSTSARISHPTAPDWQRVRQRLAEQDWAATIISTVRDDANQWRQQLRIPGPDPDRQSAWTHFYFCDDDGGRLIFDPALPTEHRCSTCGRRYSGEPRDGSWRTLMHNQAAAQAQRDALLATVGDDPAETAAALDELAMIITGYGEQYTRYQRHGEQAGIGRVLPQCLDESIWAIGLLRAVRWTESQLDDRTLTAARQLAAGVAELLRPQVSAIHNIHCWMLGALAECAVRLDDQELSDFTRTSEFGMNAQLQQGFRPEGLWYEVNPHYHYYTVSAVLSWVEAVGSETLDRPTRELIGRAITAPPRLAYSDGLLPAYGDGWPDARVSTFAAAAETAVGLIGDPAIDLSVYYAEGQQRSGIAALIFGPDEIGSATAEQPDSFCWPGSGIAVLRSPAARIALRSGPDAGGHDHHDKLAVDVETASGWRSLDLGTSGYGADFTVWMRSPAAHSTVFVGGRRQPSCDGAITDFSADRAVGETGWDGCRLRREITLTDTGWTDTVEVQLDRADEISWVFHGDGHLVADPSSPLNTPPEALTGLGVERLHELRTLQVDHDQLTVGWDADGAPSATISVPSGFVAYAGVGDGNPTGKPLGTVIISGRAERATITADFLLS